MSDNNNPYSGFGGQMTGHAHMGDTPPRNHIKDTTTAGFAKDVLEESRKQPVLVDFWAPWCGPCRQLAPVIEKVVGESNGRVKLVKLNIDDHPAIPGQLGIQSIPAVVAFVNGQPVDGFMGAIPESQVRQFIEKLAGPADNVGEAELTAALDEADGLVAAGNFEDAAQLFGAVMQADPENVRAIAGIAECMLGTSQHERASQLVANLPEALSKAPELQAVAKKLEQINEARKLGDPQALEHELALDPDNHEARIKLAKILNVQGRREEAAEHLLIIMRRDRAFDDDGARRQLLQFFDVWGPKDPVTAMARRKLSSILFS